MVQIRQQLVTSRATTSAGTNTRRYITIHETANLSPKTGARTHADLQSRGFSASWHWQVDDKIAIQSFPHTVRCWHAGNATGNASSIGIEICVNSDGDFNKAVRNAAELVKKIMKDESIPLSNVVQHNFWSGKNCPAFLRSGTRGVTWNQFKNMITSSSGTATPSTPSYFKLGDVHEALKTHQKRLNTVGGSLAVDGSFGNATLQAVRKFQSDYGLVVDGYLGQATQKRLAEVANSISKGELTVSQYNELKKEIEALKKKVGTERGVTDSFKDDWQWAKNKRFFDGSNPSHVVTREQLSAILHRYSKDNSLTRTSKNDLIKMLQEAYEGGIFSTNHTSSVEGLSEHEIIDFLISVVARMLTESNKNK